MFVFWFGSGQEFPALVDFALSGGHSPRVVSNLITASRNIMASLEYLFTTNQAPTDEESTKLKKYVARWDGKLKVITQKISALQAQLRSLNEEKTALIDMSRTSRFDESVAVT